MADASAPFLTSGTASGSTFPTLEALSAYYSRLIPAAFVHGLIEAEREVFVVRRECTLRETHIQFLRKCESALARALADAQAGRAAWDWSPAAPAQGPAAA